MLTLPLESQRIVTFIWPPVQGNKIRELKFQIDKTDTEHNSRQIHILCNGKVKVLDWDSGVGNYNNPLELIDELIDKRRRKEASKHLYFLTKKLISNGNGTVNAHLLREIFLRLSIISQKERDWESALNHSLFASELDPESSIAHEYVANCCRHSNKPLESVQFAEQAVYDHEANPRSRIELAYAYRSYSLPRLALEHARKAVDLDSTKASSYVTLAEVFIDLEDYDKASEVLKTGLKKLQSYEYTHLLFFIRGLGRSEKLWDKPEILEKFFTFAA